MASLYVDSQAKTALFDFKYALKNILTEFTAQKKEKRKIIILCIGTDKATGDSLGPLIGYKLSRLPKIRNVEIYGTLKNPVHAVNLEQTISDIYKLYKNPLIIAIDASLGKMEHIGYITVGKGSIKPGAGVKKDLGEVGDIFITGIVNFNGFLEISLLQSTRLSIVMDIADIVTDGLWKCIRENINYSEPIKK